MEEEEVKRDKEQNRGKEMEEEVMVEVERGGDVCGEGALKRRKRRRRRL